MRITQEKVNPIYPASNMHNRIILLRIYLLSGESLWLYQEGEVTVLRAYPGELSAPKRRLKKK
jgi:hypothetical protein